MVCLTDASELTPMVLTPAATAALSRYVPQTPAERVAYIRACTLVGLASALDLAVTAAQDPQIATLQSLTTDPEYGAEMVSCLGDVLACIGYLARACGQGDEAQAEDAHEFLRMFDTTGRDRTAERGRLIGLAILGDWSPLLRALWEDDQPLHRAARNAVSLWRPGPFTPVWARDDRAVAERIGKRMTAHDIPPDVRSTLARVKAQVERRLGQIIVPNR